MHQRLLVGDSAAAIVGGALVDLGESAAAVVGGTLVNLLLREDTATVVGSALVDLSLREDTAAVVGGALVDLLLVENKFHVGELHVDGWWVCEVGDLGGTLVCETLLKEERVGSLT